MSEVVIPTGWNVNKVTDIGKVITGSTPSTNNRDFFGDNFPFYKPADLDAGMMISQSKDGLSKLGLEKSRVLPENSILVVGIGASIGKTSMITKVGASNQQIHAIIPNHEKIIPKFLYYEIISPKFQNQIIANTRTTSIPIINKSKFEKLTITFPSLENQNKIVKKLDLILDKIKEKNNIILENFKKNKSYLQFLSHKMIGEILAKNMKLDNPPKNWDLQTFNDICEKNLPGFAQGDKNVENGVIHLRMNNIGIDFTLNFDLVRTVNPTAVQLEKYRLKKGDIIFNNTNSDKLVGKSFLFADSRICLYSNHLTRLRVNPKIVKPEWVLYFLRSKWLNGYFQKICNKWINQAAVNNNKISRLEIPIPPLIVQDKIINDLSDIISNSKYTSSRIEEMYAKQKKLKNDLRTLTSSVLNEAFTRGLVN